MAGLAAQLSEPIAQGMNDLRLIRLSSGAWCGTGSKRRSLHGPVLAEADYSQMSSALFSDLPGGLSAIARTAFFPATADVPRKLAQKTRTSALRAGANGFDGYLASESRQESV